MIDNLTPQQLSEVTGGSGAPTLPNIDVSTRSGRRAVRYEISSRRELLAEAYSPLTRGERRQVRVQIRTLRGALRARVTRNRPHTY